MLCLRVLNLIKCVLLKRKDVLFKTQSWVLYHDKVRFAHLVTWFMKEFSIYWCCISRENGGKSFVKIYVCFTTYKDSFTAMIFCVHSYDFIGIINEFWNLFVKPVRRSRISAYPHIRIPAYPHTRISAYPRFPPNLSKQAYSITGRDKKDSLKFNYTWETSTGWTNVQWEPLIISWY